MPPVYRQKDHGETGQGRLSVTAEQEVQRASPRVGRLVQLRGQEKILATPNLHPRQTTGKTFGDAFPGHHHPGWAETRNRKSVANGDSSLSPDTSTTRIGSPHSLCHTSLRPRSAATVARRPTPIIAARK